MRVDVSSQEIVSADEEEKGEERPGPQDQQRVHTDVEGGHEVQPQAVEVRQPRGAQSRKDISDRAAKTRVRILVERIE